MKLTIKLIKEKLKKSSYNKMSKEEVIKSLNVEDIKDETYIQLMKKL